MFCPKCGSELPEDALFCQKCGAKTAADAVETAQNAVETAQNAAGTAAETAAGQVNAAPQYAYAPQPAYPAAKPKAKWPFILAAVGVVLVAVAVVLIIVLTGGGDKGLVGKWEGTESGFAVSYEFKSNGEFSATAIGITMNGTYKVDGDKLTTTIELLGQNQETANTYKIDGDKLTLYNTDGSVDVELTRVKD